MNIIKSYFEKITFKEKYTPIAFFILTFLGFGLLANQLGFYQDDWPYVFYAFNKGIPSLVEELYYDSRPNAAWLYMALFNLLGFKPILWHLTAITLRWLTATSLWYFLKRIWPDHKREVTFSIFIFIIHPFFLIQAYAVNSILYWSGYFFFAVSLFIMARNVTENKYRVVLTVLAVFLEGVHLFTSEYFVGMVMIRPLVLYWLFSKQESTLRARLTKTLAHWLPYLGALAAYIFWRIFLYTPPPTGDRNAPEVLYSLLTRPIATIADLIRTALQDTVIITFVSWYRTLSPNLFAFSSIFSGFVFGIILLTFLATFFYFSKNESHESARSSSRWLASPLIFGLLAILLGMAPIWIIGEDIVTHINQFAGSRYGIGSTLGAAIIVVVILENLIDSRKKKFAAMAVIISLAVGMHLANEKEFDSSWEKQERFAQQLIWRAPEIESGTAIVTDEEILGFMGGYSVSFSIITTYQPGDIQTPPYWYFPFYYNGPNVPQWLNGVPLEDRKLSMEFSGSSDQMILLSFNPEMKRCLWVLSPNDTNLRLVNDDMRQLSAGSDLELIKQNNSMERNLPESIYGKQNNKPWCYYFEKADLARQYQQWDKITQLWEEAQSNGEQADNGFENIPFIEGYGHQGDWEQVKLLTKSANRITEGLEPSLCSALDRLSANAPESPERDETIQKLKDDLVCTNYQ